MNINTRREICWGLIWGLGISVILSILFAVNARSAVLPGDEGDIDVSISGDTVRIELDKDGITKRIAVGRDGYTRTPGGIKVANEILIEDGRIYVDGVELTEEELDRLSIDREEEETGLKIEIGDRDKKVVRRERLATIYTDTDDDIVKFDDITVERDQRVYGDVVSIGGDVTVYGEIDGDVVSVFGDVFLRDEAYIRGDVSAPFGKIDMDEDVYIGGEKATSKKFRKRHTASFDMGARFNRVEGFTLTPGLKYESKNNEYPSLKLETAYAFTLKRWEYNFQVSHKFGRVWGPKLSGSMYQTVTSNDMWLIPWQEENSIAAALFKEDFLDYYWMRGFTGGAGIWYGDHVNFGAHYTGAKIENLKRTADKALFGGKKKFRENWSTVLPDSAAILAMEGNLREIGLSASYDTRDDKYDATNGILANLSFSQALDSDSADFEYKVTDAEFKWYYPLAHDQTLFIRLRGGFSDDDLPLFRRYFIGGLGSLRGYEYKEFEGNRYVLFNTDYIWRFYKSDFGAGLFFDMGRAGFGKSGFDSADFKSSAGLAFIISDAIRINLAQRLDDTSKSPVFSMRAKILF